MVIVRQSHNGDLVHGVYNVLREFRPRDELFTYIDNHDLDERSAFVSDEFVADMIARKLIAPMRYGELYVPTLAIMARYTEEASP
jgi:hypothetical protein